MNVLPKRVFISKLSGSIQKQDLESKFSHYGKVTSVEINRRKNSINEDQALFAYVNLEINELELQRCLRDFANKKWKGEFLDVQVAKESFLSKLKREREEEVNKKTKSENHYGGYDVPISNGSGIAGDLVEDIQLKQKIIKFDDFAPKQAAEDITKQCLNVISQDKNKDEKQIKANLKRIQSNIGLINEYKQQKRLIKVALSNLDQKPKNKIIFDVDDYGDDKKQYKKTKRLFDESDDDDDGVSRIELKKQFEGQSGQKLLQLQSRFHNDRRFVMDEKFLENEEDNAQEDDVPVENEKQAQLNILETILGGNMQRKTARNTFLDDEKQKGMLRFDPNQPEHSTYEIKRQERKEKVEKTKKREHKGISRSEEETPHVSKTKFYKVADDLKNVFEGDTKSFNFLSSREENYVRDDSIGEQSPTVPLPHVGGNFNNAFKYDSSDSESETQQPHSLQANEVPQAVTHQDGGSNSMKFWSEPFFFQNDDFRFQEGLDFIKRLEGEEQTDFVKMRRNLKEIVRAKVRNVKRKNVMFKKKLGGHKKRMKIKKALKKS